MMVCHTDMNLKVVVQCWKLILRLWFQIIINYSFFLFGFHPNWQMEHHLNPSQKSWLSVLCIFFFLTKVTYFPCVPWHHIIVGRFRACHVECFSFWLQHFPRNIVVRLELLLFDGSIRGNTAWIREPLPNLEPKLRHYVPLLFSTRCFSGRLRSSASK